MKLFNSGYIVQQLQNDSCLAANPMYKGVERFQSWPLKRMSDKTSIELEEEAWNKWFSCTDSIETVTDKNFLLRYVLHCCYNNIDTVIIKVETSRSNTAEPDELHVIEVLGFDCIVGSDLSYLNVTEECLKKYFFKTYRKLNKNGLCENAEDVYEFLQDYNDLLKQGVNLESYGMPFPARLSVVDLQ